MANTVEIIIKALDATKGGFSSATKGLQSFGKLSGAVMTAAVSAAVAAGGAYVTMAKNFADSADEIGKLSQKTGETTDYLSRLKFVAGENSIEWGAFQKALRAASDEAAKSGQSFNQLLSSQADRFASFADGAGKAAEAQRIFGKAGADLIPLLNLGSKGLADATKEAERFTTIIDSQTAATADEFGDTLERVGASLRKALGDGLKQAMPFMLEMSRNLLAMVDTLRDADGSFTSFGDGMKFIGKSIAVTSALALSSIKIFQGFGDVVASALIGKGVGFIDAGKDFFAEFESGYERVKKVMAGDITLPTPKSTDTKLPGMSNPEDVEKYNKLYSEMINSGINGAEGLARAEKEAHDKRVQQIENLKISEESKNEFIYQSSAISNANKIKMAEDGSFAMAEIDAAYHAGNIQRAQDALTGEYASSLARVQNNQAMINIMVDQWKAASESFRVMWAKVGLSIQEGAISGLQRGMEGIIKGTMKASDAMRALGQAIIDSVVSAFTQMIAKLLIMKTLGFIFGGGGFLGDLFGFKGGGFTGFAGGGYTGNGGTSDIAGVVHKREYVVPAAATSAIGVSALDRMTAAADAGMISAGSGGGSGYGGQPMSVSMLLDGQVLARALGVMSRDGTLELSASAIV